MGGAAQALAAGGPKGSVPLTTANSSLRRSQARGPGKLGKEGSRGRGRPTNGLVEEAPTVTASGTSEGGDRSSAASPSRSTRFRGVDRDKMASPPPSAARPGRSHGQPSQLCRRGSAAGVRPVSLSSRNSTLERGDGSEGERRADELIHSHSKASLPGQSHLFPVPSQAGECTA